MEINWQSNLIKIKDRGQYLLQTEKFADCRFLVGTTSNQSLIAGHRLILAMASPVFEHMFYGSLPEKNEPIIIPDVQPNVFEAMLDYIYTDEISISSFDNACELYYVAKKYMLPHVVEHCKNLLVANLSPKNACRAYELAKIYEESSLMESSMKIIIAETQKIIIDPSFMDIEVSTLMTILDQNSLNIDSELDLFNCLLKFANEHNILNDGDKENKKTDADSENASVLVNEMKLRPEKSNSALTSTSAVEDASSSSASGNASESAANMNNIMNAKRTTIDKAMLREAVKKIRFLTMTPQQFTEGPARSKLLNQNEAFAILMKISNPTINDCPMPEGFCLSSKRDCGGIDLKKLERYCVSTSKLSDSFSQIMGRISYLKFKVNTNIYLLGIKLKLTDMKQDIDGFFAYIQDMECAEIACANSIENKIDAMFELTFNSPVFIQRNQTYKIKINNNFGYLEEMYIWDREIQCNGVKFNFFNPGFHVNIDSIIGGIIFSK